MGSQGTPSNLGEEQIQSWKVGEDNMCSLHLSVAIVVTWAALTMAQGEDPTKQDGGKGPDVVEAVVRLIHESCVFPNDHLLLRRLAFVETNDGLNPDNGGIWAVSIANFRSTQNDWNLSTFYADITERFGIDWNSLTFDQLRKPIYSGLATALYIAQKFNGQAIDISKEDQGAWYQKSIHPQNPNAAYTYTKQSERLETKCRSNNIDLAFVVDSSSSLSVKDFDSAKTFASNVVDTFNIAPDSVQIAFMTFSSDVQLQFYFNNYSSKDAVKNAISRVQMKLGKTATDKALDFAASQLFTPAGGVRPNSAKVAVLLTDGNAEKQSNAVASAQKLKDLGVTIFVIGVGDGVDRSKLESLASNPVCTHVEHLANYTDLDQILSDIRQMSCEAPVVIHEKDLPQQFPCGTSINFMISFSSPAKVTVQPTQGFVNIYGSFFNNHSPSISIQLATNASASQAAIIDVNQTSYINVDATGNDPAICHTNNTYTLTIQEPTPPAEISTITTTTTSTLAPVTSTGAICNYGLKNGDLFYHPYPEDPAKFIQCDEFGQAFLMNCPKGLVWSQNVLNCIRPSFI